MLVLPKMPSSETPLWSAESRPFDSPVVLGLGSLLGALLGAIFVTLFPYLIEAALLKLPDAQGYAGMLFAVNYAGFGVVMIAFLIFEPQGLVGIWHRVQAYF